MQERDTRVPRQEIFYRIRFDPARRDFVISPGKAPPIPIPGRRVGGNDLSVNGGVTMYRRGGAKMYHGLGGSLSP